MELMTYSTMATSVCRSAPHSLETILSLPYRPMSSTPSKEKSNFYPYEVRIEMPEAIRYVDLVIPENCWEQKMSDSETYHADVVCMGSDWRGDPRFEALRTKCVVAYFDRTSGISTTDVKTRLGN